MSQTEEEKEIWQQSTPLPHNIHDSEIIGFQNKEYLYKFSLDQWYDDLKEHTFHTQFLPLTIPEANALLDIQSEGADDLLEGMRLRLDEAINQYDEGGFVKLNHRSPKDVAIREDNVLCERITWDLVRFVDEDDRVRQAQCLNKAFLLSLRVTSGASALGLLIRSYRIREDLSQDIRYPEFFKSMLVVREFREIDPSMEFRGFVHHGKLNALSQYESGIYYPELLEQKEEVLGYIMNFFEEVSSKINLKSYVIDFAVLPNGEVKIVELNPFMSKTSGCLFSWREDRDIIFNGPFEFRTLDEEPEDPLEYLFTYHLDSFYEDVRNQKRGWWIRLIASLFVMLLLWFFAV